jgi:hypothetical protein
MTKTINLLLLLILLIHSKGQSQSLDTLVNVGNHQLHFKIIKGKGTPILFESGNGEDGSVWEPLLQDIHKATGATLITYDRAGLGKSGIDTTKISFKREIKNLKKALKKIGYKKDYFLVAHSFGSFYASEFSQRIKGKITGAVFIDVATPCMTTKEWASKYKKELSAEVWVMLKKHREGLYYVLQNFPNIADYMSTRYISNDIPLTLIVAENLPNENTLKTEEDKINWVKCLKEFGNLPNHKYVLAKNTDHKVWEKEPKMVIEEITRLYLKVNK